MDFASEIENILKSLHPEKAAGLREDLKHLMKKPKKKKAKSKKYVSFSPTPAVKVNNYFVQVTSKDDIIKHFAEETLCDSANQPPYVIKANLVSLYEMLAMTEEDRSHRDFWRQKAAKVVLIDDQKTLLSYLTSVATGIRANSL